MPLSKLINRLIIPTLVGHIPPVNHFHTQRFQVFGGLECGICRAHDSLAEVVEAVSEMLDRVVVR
jgi:hypothetical protein